MKSIRHILASLLCCLFACGNLSAQNNSMSGKDFWVITAHSNAGSGFTGGTYWSDSLLLYMVGDTATLGTVDNDYYGFHIDFQVIPGQVTQLKIPVSMTVFDHAESNNWSVRTSHRGVRVRSNHNIFLYMQDICTIIDSSNIYLLWENNLSYSFSYVSPLSTNVFRSEKNPVPPLPNQVRERFPDSFEEWWFDRCASIGIGPLSGEELRNVRYVTALEDSTVVIFTFNLQQPPYSQITDSVMLQKEETVFLVDINSFHHEEILTLKTNCKPVVCMSGYRGTGYVGNFHCYYHNNIEIYTQFFGSFQPFTSPVRQGYDYLCKKLENDRFDKGIYYLKIRDCSDPLTPLWSDSVDRFMYNEIVAGDDFASFMDNYPGHFFFRTYNPITGSHRRYWGSASTYVNVPYTFLRSSSPIFYDRLNGPFFFIYKESGPAYPIYGYLPPDSIGSANSLTTSPYVSTQPTDLMVKDWVYPTTRNNVKRKIHLEDAEALDIDTLYADVQIYVHENGLNTTYFNGQLLPAEVFDSFPMTHGDYYVTQMAFYNEGIPEIIRISNVNGFSAYVDEFGYNVLPAPGGHPEIDDITKVYYYHAGASGCYYTDYPDNGIGLSPHNYDTVHRCLGDTLDLMVEHNPDSVPVEWIVDGESYFTQGMAFILTALDTMTVQCILHYECPDTTTTFVAVVPPPLFTVAHDTTVCNGATLSVEQPNVLSYLWSNGATTPSITVDSAGTFQVSVTNIGCRAESDSFHVSLYGQSSVDFGNDSILCELATLLLDASQPHPAQYFWQDASTNTTYLVYQDGDYWVVVTDNCLGASDTINIGYLNDFAINLGPDTLLCEGKTLTLDAEVPYCDFLWQDGSTQPVYVVRGPGLYSVEVSNRCFSHWDAVNVDYEHCAQELYLPNAFTPGPDALNAVFLPVFSYPDEIEEYRMEIYNRWGTLVFRTEEITFGWDGANAMDGVYAVVVHYKTRGEKAKTVKGSVTVVR